MLLCPASSSLARSLIGFSFDLRFFFSGELIPLVSDDELSFDCMEMSLDVGVDIFFCFRVARFGVS